MARNPSAKALRELDRAQMLIYDAWEARGARRTALAHEALAISPLCADAYSILAQDAEPGSDEELVFLRKSLAAGEAALGQKAFEELAGEFWGWHETRPYMRARLGFAQALWTRGERDEAARHAEAMLALNPNDNQGIRYVLASWLIELQRDDALQALLKRYEKDDSAFLSYPAALAAFRRGGESEECRKLLATALISNAHVPDFLLNTRRMPKTAPAFYSPGQETEAVLYVRDHAQPWRTTPGALDWLATHAGATAQPPKRRSKRTGGRASPQ